MIVIRTEIHDGSVLVASVRTDAENETHVEAKIKQNEAAALEAWRLARPWVTT